MLRYFYRYCAYRSICHISTFHFIFTSIHFRFICIVHNYLSFEFELWNQQLNKLSMLRMLDRISPFYKNISRAMIYFMYAQFVTVTLFFSFLYLITILSYNVSDILFITEYKSQKLLLNRANLTIREYNNYYWFHLPPYRNQVFFLYVELKTCLLILSNLQIIIFVVNENS